jgi:hypothetical protein
MPDDVRHQLTGEEDCIIHQLVGSGVMQDGLNETPRLLGTRRMRI